ncbi:MAG: NAD(P)-binding domain-containing protein [Myxococcales bacterium]|nr:NAD(P)-binding domain-containing protein [Myxococcales bacterium]
MSDEERRREHRTLFAIPLADPRERGQIAGQRRRRAGDGHASSDVSRFWPMAVAAVAGAVGVTAAWALSAGEPSAGVGAVALPHRAAKLACDSCHEEGTPNATAVKACKGCHGPHPSLRPGHARLLSEPIGRCVQGETAVSLCFDEHQRWSAVAPPRPGGVCAKQHDNGRFAVWEAAREVAVATPLPARGGGADAAWLYGGLLAAAFGGLGTSGLLRLRRRRRRQEERPVLKRADRVRLPQIDESTCLGCYACVDACPYDVLAIERYVAVVAQPEACCGLTLCEQVCPNGSLVITDGEPIGDQPRLTASLESEDVPGLYLAGDITGVPLIKNAIHQGRQVVKALSGGAREMLDVLIVGAGPAGISAALACKERGLRYRVIEQGSVAQSIRSFPRGKLVFDQPLDLPVVGKLWLEESTKEELLAKWSRMLREEKLAIDEGVRLLGLEPISGGFLVRAQEVEGEAMVRHRAAQVVLAIGRRGSPRRLPIPIAEEHEAKVFYHLADARSFAHQRVVVVGLGDVAMETAGALARQPGTEVTLVVRGDGFRRGKARNVAEVKRLAEAGTLALRWQSQVTAVDGDGVVVRSGDGEQRLACDALFVMIGSQPPLELLERLGVRLGAPSGELSDAGGVTRGSETREEP